VVNTVVTVECIASQLDVESMNTNSSADDSERDRFITSVMTRTAHGLDNLCTCTNNIHADMTRQSAQSIHATMTVTKQHLFAELVDTWLQSLEKSTQFPVLG